MDNKVIARINWIPTEQGGKKRFPLTKYSTAAHFHGDEEGQDWSVVLSIISNNDNYETLCSIKFLFPEKAPGHLLVAGNKFELYELGKVADGEIIES
ncbi:MULTISPECIES: hypothetical protein [unclassified Paenibacillus]|uniref:hypothetical protein n=1 Tax=unclassified Paenibacillus TaxID=185978 RepID=UPI002404D1E5|nr:MULTISPECIES: hypothetical protein [unclassified Paenibacillus]MDF9845534.1 hypothetical protein [Paenibacillus sp. PastF-2]MDF9852110.1 hypothetical protein [Paenibacillus sp. PastM-2]MDF9858650.1 hypothetical protein [Paenibacillus sp. PastF-1]MDH6483947.1 hypothetical protein [Paenibacillus sp. PastH-2]MDH6511328.1 hypothetical protein [Paenibacillus sp. PastM-3]